MKHTLKAVFVIILGLQTFAAALAADDAGARGRNTRIFVLPPPGAVKVDGDLGDWDLSGQIELFVSRESRNAMNARVALMFDAEALYVAGTVRDDSPMMNRHDPAVEAGRAWDADCVQLRMMLDPAAGFPLEATGYHDQLVHMLFWHYTGAQQACLQLAYGMNYQPPKAGWPQGVVPAGQFQGAYRKAADGRSYAFEYRIPWATLDAKRPPRAYDLVASSLQVQWGSADGLSIVGGGSAPDLMSRPGFSFQSTACWGKALFSPRGRLPAALTQTEDRASVEPLLPLAFEYPLPADGEVSLALQNAEGATVRRLVSQAPRRAGAVREAWDGLDDAGCVLPPGEYRWTGLHHPPLTTRYVMGLHNSGQPSWVTADGLGSWGADHGMPRAACAVPGGVVLGWDVAENRGGILRVDLEGRKRWGILHGAQHLASDGQRLYASGGGGFVDGSGIQVFALEDGRPLNFGRGTPKAESPPGEGDATITGLACARGTLYAACARRNAIYVYNAEQGTLRETWQVAAPGPLATTPSGALLAVSQGRVLLTASGRALTLVQGPLDEPTGLAVGQDGLIYVACQGRMQSVFIFAPDGAPVGTIGRPGGRPAVGPYEREGMLAPAGLALDERGFLWVAETLDSPKRISVWHPQQGGLVREFFGGGHYATFVSLDPAREDEAYCHMVVWAVDLAKGTWSPKSTMWRATQPDMIGANGWLRVLTAKDGVQYAWGRSHRGSTLYRRTGEVWKPILEFVWVMKGNSFVTWPPYPFFGDQQKYRNGYYCWQDANDDQCLQENEVRSAGDLQGFSWLDADLNLWCEGAGGHVLRPVGRGADGRPVYDVTKAELTGVSGGHEFGGLFCDADGGSLYTILPDDSLSRWTPRRQRLWSYPTMSWRAALNKPIASPGRLWGVTSGLGTAGDFTGVATYFGTVNLLTRDGLFVAQILKDQRRGELGPDVIACEAFAGQLVRMNQSGRTFFLGGDSDGRITEVLGLEAVKPLEGGALTITEADAQAAAAGLEEFARRRAQAQPLFVELGEGSLKTAPGVTRVVDERRRFTAKAAFDAVNLYVEYEVVSPADFVNAEPDPLVLFKGGNALDLQLALDPAAAPKRVKPAPGDLRLLISRRPPGEAVAMLYLPKLPGFKGEPQVLRSPTGQESFDLIRPLAQVALAYSKQPDGFRVRATIPWTELGGRLRPVSTVRMDLGYLFGNETGTQCALRAYWANHGPTAAIVNDIPSESRLEPALWGTAAVE
jgi:hypothetical protein